MSISSLAIQSCRFFERHKYFVLGVALLAMIVGITIDRLVGGAVAKVAGSIQFITVVVYFFFASVYFSVRRYGDGTPVPRGRQQLFVVLAVVAAYFILFTTVQIVKNVS